MIFVRNKHILITTQALFSYFSTYRKTYGWCLPKSNEIKHKKIWFKMWKHNFSGQIKCRYVLKVISSRFNWWKNFALVIFFLSATKICVDRNIQIFIKEKIDAIHTNFFMQGEKKSPVRSIGTNWSNINLSLIGKKCFPTSKMEYFYLNTVLEK